MKTKYITDRLTGWIIKPFVGLVGNETITNKSTFPTIYRIFGIISNHNVGSIHFCLVPLVRDQTHTSWRKRQKERERDI